MYVPFITSSGERLRGKTVFITGASSGIGEALAWAFVAEGARVALAARRTDRLQRIRREIEEAGGKAIALTCDVTDRKSIDRAVARTIKAFKHIDITVANAGFAVTGRFAKLETSDFRRQFDTNVFGTLDTIYATLPHLKKTKGRLAIVSSIAGRVAFPSGSAYCGSKFALCGISEALYHELADFGISVTLVNPGFVKTEISFVNNNGVKSPERKDMIPDWLAVTADHAASEIVDAVCARQFEIFVSGHGKVIALISRYLPRTTRIAQHLGAKRVMHQIDDLLHARQS